MAMTRMLNDVALLVGEIRGTAERVIEICDQALERIAGGLEMPMTLYSQRDPRWRDQVYAGRMSFGQAGCYVTCVAMIASLTGSDDNPPVVAIKLREAGCFSGTYLSHPERIPQAYLGLQWDGLLDWRNQAADLMRLQVELAQGPVIIEVEFSPGGAAPPNDQHFVVAESFTNDGKDLYIVDPWDGARTRLMERYALDSWDLARAIYGARLLRVGEDS